MSLQEVKLQLQKYHITPNKLLGQNFLVDDSLFPKLSNYAALNNNDIVLDAGAGFGFLARFIADKCQTVVAVEKDPQIAKVLHEQVKSLNNVVVVEGDVLRVEVPFFNKVISLPPYYLSSQLVTWLLDRSFDCAVLVVQKEFADRLVAPVSSEKYGWLTVITFPHAQSELLDEVPKLMFYPQPDVDSVILRLNPGAYPPFIVKDVAFFRRLTKWLFTQRNKKLGNAVASFIRSERKINKAEAEKMANELLLKDERVRYLTPKDFGELSNALSN